MQGVIKAYDPDSRLGVLMCDTDLADYDLADNALEGSVFRMLRQGQRVIFDLDDCRPGDAPAPRLRGRHGHTRLRVSPRSISISDRASDETLPRLKRFNSDAAGTCAADLR